MTDERLDAVERACAELARAGQPITFVAVAERSGISRVSLYRNSALRASVEEHRSRAQAATTLSGLAAELAHQRLALDALAIRVRNQEERLRRIERLRKRGSAR